MSHGRKGGKKLLMGLRRESVHAIDLEAMGHALDDIRLREEEEDIFASDHDPPPSSGPSAPSQTSSPRRRSGELSRGRPSVAAASAYAATATAEDDSFLTTIPEDTLAQQITLLDMAAFKAIKPKEFHNGAWMKDDKAELAPNIVKLTQRFNDMSHWVKMEVLYATSAESRINRLSHFIKVAKKLHEYNNLHSLLAILSGLQSAPIYRLKTTWKAVKDRVWTQFEKLDAFMSEEENHKSVRDHLNVTKLPCIPYLGMFLTDLTHLRTAKNEAEAAQGQAAVLHVEEEFNRLITELRKFQDSHYAFDVLSFVREYLEREVTFNVQPSSTLDKELYERSQEIEPRRDGSEVPGDDDEGSPATPSQRFSLAAVRNQILKNGSLTFRGSRPPSRGNGHRKTRSLGNTVALFGTGGFASNDGGNQLLFDVEEGNAQGTHDDHKLPSVLEVRQARGSHVNSTPTRPSRLKISVATADDISDFGDAGTVSSSDSDDESDPFPPAEEFGRQFSNASGSSGLDPSAESPATPAPEDIVYQGVLRQRGRQFQSYKYFWAQLLCDRIILYPQESSARAPSKRSDYGSLPRKEVALVQHFSVSVDAGSKHNSFYVYPQGAAASPVKFQALVSEQRDMWVSQLSTLAASGAPAASPFRLPPAAAAAASHP